MKYINLFEEFTDETLSKNNYEYRNFKIYELKNSIINLKKP